MNEEEASIFCNTQETVPARLMDIMRQAGSELLSPVPVDAEVEVLDSWGG